MRGKLVFLIPEKITPQGVTKLSSELSRQRIPVLGKEHNTLLAKWDSKMRTALRKGIGTQSFYLDRIPPSHIMQMPADDARIASVGIGALAIEADWSLTRRSNVN